MQVDVVYPVAVDLSDEEMPVRQREHSVRAAEELRRPVTADTRRAKLSHHVPWAWRQDQEPAVDDVGQQEVPAGQQHRVVRMAEAVGGRAGYIQLSVAPGYPIVGNRDQGNGVIHLLGRDDG